MKMQLIVELTINIIQLQKNYIFWELYKCSRLNL